MMLMVITCFTIHETAGKLIKINKNHSLITLTNHWTVFCYQEVNMNVKLVCRLSLNAMYYFLMIKNFHLNWMSKKSENFQAIQAKTLWETNSLDLKVNQK